MWKQHPTSSLYECLDGARDMLVRREATNHGFLWQFKRRAGYLKSLDGARAFVEACRDADALLPVPERERVNA